MLIPFVVVFGVVEGLIVVEGVIVVRISDESVPTVIAFDSETMSM